MTGIVDIQLGRLEKLLAERKITIELDEAARIWLADAGYDPVYGARPLKRVIQRNLQDPLAELILGGEVLDGDTVQVTARDGHLIVNGHDVDGGTFGAFRGPGGTGIAPGSAAIN